MYQTRLTYYVKVILSTNIHIQSKNVLTELRYYNMKLATQRKFHEMR